MLDTLTEHWSEPNVPLRDARVPDAGRSRPYRVVVHGLRHFCQKLPELLGNARWEILDRSRHSPQQLLCLINDLRSCDLVFNWAGRIDMGHFLRASRFLGARKQIFFWCGSDVLRSQKLFAAGKSDDWIARHFHWAASPILAKEVRSMGLNCEYVQASFVEVREPTPLPKEFSVLFFLPRADLAELYGWDRVKEVANALPGVKFQLIGLHPGQTVQVPPNVSVHPWTQDLRPLYEGGTVLWRPVRHDAGISFMVLEALSFGRHVLYSYPLAGAIEARETEKAKVELLRLKALHDSGDLSLNQVGMDTVKHTYAREVVRKELHRRWEEIIRS